MAKSKVTTPSKILFFFSSKSTTLIYPFFNQKVQVFIDKAAIFSQNTMWPQLRESLC